MLLLEKNLL